MRKTKPSVNLFVDDERDLDTFMPGSYTGTWLYARNFKQAVSLLSLNNINEISLDHDLGKGKTGYDLAKWMTANKKWPEKVHVHSANPVGRKNIISEYEFYLSKVKNKG
jgi:hypothetical protein